MPLRKNEAALYQVSNILLPFIPVNLIFPNTTLFISSKNGFEKTPSIDALPPARSVAMPSVIALALPEISRNTSTPIPSVSSKISFCTFTFVSRALTKTSAPKSFANFNRKSLGSTAIIFSAPASLQSATAHMPIGPMPNTETVFPAISPSKTVCTALPSGSCAVATQCGSDLSFFHAFRYGNVKYSANVPFVSTPNIFTFSQICSFPVLH